MKNTGFKRLFTFLLALLLVAPTVLMALPAAAEEEQSGGVISGIVSDSEKELSDALDAENYKTYLKSMVASLRYDDVSRSLILRGAYNDGRDEENEQYGRLYEIWQALLSEGVVDNTDVDSEAAVMMLDDATKTKIISRLTDDEIVEYLKASVAFEGIDLLDCVVSDLDQTGKNDSIVRPATADDFATPLQYKEGSIYLPDAGSVTWTFTIPEGQGGFYNICFNYYAIEGSVSTIERMMHIDDEILFSEARSLSFSKNWEYSYYDADEDGIPNYLEADPEHSFRQDKNGNDLRPEISQKPEWRTYYCSDSEGYYSDYFAIYFSEGVHTITLSGVRESLIIGDITLLPPETLTTYEDYIKKHEAANGGEHKYGSSVIRLEGETPSYVSDTSVYMANDRSSAINSPTNASSQYFNVIGRNGYTSMGQWASYEFTVEDEGFYTFVMRYHQNTLEGMFVSRAIKLWSSDGEYGYADGTASLPFEEASSARFDYSKDWKASAAGGMVTRDGQSGEEYEKFEFYFKPNVTYRVVFEVSLGDLAEIIQSVQESLEVINECYLNILKLTGASPDEYRNYNFNQVMPGTVRNLLVESINLTKISKQLKALCGSSGSHVAQLDSVARLLHLMGSDEDEIAANLSTLKSYIGTLGTWINSSKAQGLPLDYIQVQSAEAKMPKSEAGIWDSIKFECVAFFSSFVTDYNSMGVTEGTVCDETIDVWLATGRDQSLIWRNMIDNQFTSREQIAVNLKLVAAGTILPSVLAGQGPDVYLGLASSDAINYAIRSAVLSIQNFEGYNTTLGYDRYDELTDTYYLNGEVIATTDVKYNNANIVPLALYGKTFGLPETTNFPMLFYRKDIFAEEGLSIPTTWDEMLEIAPTFQANNMDIGLGYAGAINIFIYQNGGSLWHYENDPVYGDLFAGAHIGLDTNEARGAFDTLVRLYTDYSFPVSFDAANRFRTGEMPLIVADYCATYNQLIVFASEISGLWEFAALPGTERVDAEGNTIIDRRSVASVTAVVMLEGCEAPEAAWKFMSWQAEDNVQAQYGNEMVALVGPAAKYATANMQALKLLSWSTAETNALMEQFEQLAAVPNYPGSYIITRYTQFAFLDAVNNGTDPVNALDSYVNTINKELERKRKEFHNKPLKEYDGENYVTGDSFLVPPLKPGQSPDEYVEANKDKEWLSPYIGSQ